MDPSMAPSMDPSGPFLATARTIALTSASISSLPLIFPSHLSLSSLPLISPSHLSLSVPGTGSVDGGANASMTTPRER